VGYKISVDVGGTFTDLTIANEDIFLGRHKSPTTPEDLTLGVFNCLNLAARQLKIKLEELLSNTDVFIHASTTATNAILEEKGVKTGVICTKGTKYTLWRGEGRRKDIFNFKASAPKPLIRPYLCLEVRERINKDGEILVPLDEEEVRAAVRQLKEWDVKAIAVCLLWSIINPVNEKRIGEIIQEEWPEIEFSLSHEVQPIIREYQRMSCVTLNAMLQPIVSAYLENLRDRLSASGFSGEPLVVISSGGLVPMREIMKKPVFMLFSGPSMGPISGNYYAGQNDVKNCIVIDMGGTSFDVSTVINRQITVTNEGRIRNYPTGVSANEILTLGAGGGSIAWIDPDGILNVGPESSGSNPGPACYMRGGKQPTVTDACVALGYIIPDHFLGGKMEISGDLAKKAIQEKIAEPLKMTVERAALGIYRIACEKMIGGILDMTVRRGIDPREFAIVSGGGATGLFAAILAKEIGVKQIIIPKTTSVLCAFGGLNANIAMSTIASNYTDSMNFNYPAINSTLNELEQKGRNFLDRIGAPPENREFEFYAVARYPMQVTELEIQLKDRELTADNVSTLIADFHQAHMIRYKTADPSSPVEFVMWRSVARNRTPGIAFNPEKTDSKSTDLPLVGMQAVYFENEKDYVETPCYDGEKMRYGMNAAGPAIILLSDTSIVVPDGCRVSVHKQGYFVMDIAS